MHKQFLVFALLIALAASVAVIFAGHRFDDRQKLVADLTATTTPAATSTPTLLDVLENLQDQVQLLGKQVTGLRSELEVTNLRTMFTRAMKRGDSGDDVSKLQELLEKFPDVYATTSITGFYGRLTEEAVIKFQSQEGLKKTGVVDLDTRNKLYELAADSAIEDSTSTEFTPTDLSSVAELQTSNGPQDQASIGDLQNEISQLTSDLSNVQANIQASIEELQGQVSQLALGAGGSQTSAPGTPAPAPTPSSQPLTISGVQAINITKASTTIIWTTNNPSTSEVDYSQSSALPSDKTSLASNSTLATSHSATLLNLTAGTKYYYRVVSKSNTGAGASSTILSFSTSH